ncbi:hypothetical protein [Burkholderia sp. Ac-20379]|uniref:hypothetical protein n=1 Tax=Burkholderia sp. Ac-20379 TaxID=2703900 RepID=UPI001981A055|nr:hypothetical protein [Burkholderia sp. Ac-20379]MBN3724232.1 hypothetical protein [Burkholderia sp. Ac-20379]
MPVPGAVTAMRPGLAGLSRLFPPESSAEPARRLPWALDGSAPVNDDTAHLAPGLASNLATAAAGGENRMDYA